MSATGHETLRPFPIVVRRAAVAACALATLAVLAAGDAAASPWAQCKVPDGGSGGAPAPAGEVCPAMASLCRSLRSSVQNRCARDPFDPTGSARDRCACAPCGCEKFFRCLNATTSCNADCFSGTNFDATCLEWVAEFKLVNPPEHGCASGASQP